MQITEATWRHAIKIWWSFTWRMLIFGIVFGIILSLMNIVMRLDPQILALINSLFSMGVSIWVFRELPGIAYSDFTLALVTRDGASGEGSPQPPDPV